VPTARYDTIVIGAGLSGLAAGIRLAQYDRSVVVLERHSLWGGLNSFYKQAGRRIDTGLHALTNWVPERTPGVPLTRVLRQLRIDRGALKLAEQTYSRVVLPGLELRFSNDFELFRSEVARAFPDVADRFDAFVAGLDGYDVLGAPLAEVRGARAVLDERLGDERLIDALLLPCCYYGSARENDVDWDQFQILFRALFLEGFCLPEGGIKTLLDVLLARLRAVGGELRMRSGVRELLLDQRPDGTARVVGVRLDDGTELACERVISSAGWVETLRLAGRAAPAAEHGRLSFVETVSFLDRPAHALGLGAAITFYSDRERFAYERPDADVDPTSGVICSTDNYGPPAASGEGVLRVTCLADPERWERYGADEYAARKQAATTAMLDAAAPHAFDPRPHTTHFDAFTPRTIRHYTGHVGGAIYGSPTKRRDGATGIDGLVLCGTDQGMLGVVGALLSGITMANLHGLRTAATAGGAA
jgi:phytoene dehydrogenase-like protein